MAAPIVIAATPATTSMGAALLASAGAGATLLPFIAVVAVGSYIVLKGIDMVDDKVEDWRENRHNRRYGADQNNGRAYREYRERRSLSKPDQGTVRTQVNTPTSSLVTPQAQATG